MFGFPRVNERLPEVLARWCPASATPHTVEATIATVANQQAVLANSQQNIAASLRASGAPKTIMDTNPILGQMAQKICQVTDPAQLGAFWKMMPHTSKVGSMAALQNAVTQTGGSSAIISTKMSADFYAGRWTATNYQAIDEGLSPLRVATYAQGPEVIRQLTREQNTVTMLEVHNPHGDHLVQLLLNANANYISKQPNELEEKLKSWDGTIKGIWGDQADLYTTYHQDVTQNASEIAQMINQNYYNVRGQACVRVEYFVHRQFDTAMRLLLAGPVPTAANPRPVTIAPAYSRILECLRNDTLSTLIDLPASLFQAPQQLPPARVPVVDRAPPAAGQVVPPGPPNQQPPPAGRRQIRGPEEWAPRLRAGFLAAGFRGLFTEGSPFHRPDNPPRHRARVMRLEPNQAQEICLSMACKGECMDNCPRYHGQLTPAEEDLVAAEGNLAL